LEGHVKDFCAVLRAHASFFRHLPAIRKKRKALVQKRPSQVYKGNIALEHYVKRRKLFTELPNKKISS